MIAILGPAGSGKTALAKVLEEKYDFKRTVAFTTRNPRDNEKNNYDYQFVSLEEFKALDESGFFAETASYDGNYYATPVMDISENGIIVVSPRGFRNLKKIYVGNIFSVYLNLPRLECFNRMISRGDDFDDSYKRTLMDVGLYNGLEDEVDTVITDKKMTPSEIANYIITKLG